MPIWKYVRATPETQLSTSALMQILWKAVGSAVSAFIGGVTGVIAMLVFGWQDWRVCLFTVGMFVVPVWLLILLPLYALLPSSSRIWRPTICTGLGAASGAILLTVYFGVSRDIPFDLIWIFLPIAVVVGGVTSFVASATTHYFHGTRNHELESKRDQVRGLGPANDT